MGKDGARIEMGLVTPILVRPESTCKKTEKKAFASKICTLPYLKHYFSIFFPSKFSVTYGDKKETFLLLIKTEEEMRNEKVSDSMKKGNENQVLVNPVSNSGIYVSPRTQ